MSALTDGVLFAEAAALANGWLGNYGVYHGRRYKQALFDVFADAGYTQRAKQSSF